jgi:putative hydrolase of the HAD superfamily
MDSNRDEMPDQQVSATVIGKLLRTIADDIQVVLFDLGGVLVELRGVPTMMAWLDNRVSVEEMWRLWLESPTVRRFESGRMSPEEFAKQITREMSLPVGPEQFTASFQSWLTGLYPGALELVHSVPSRFTTATLSNTSQLHWQRLMTEFQLEHAFDRHFASHLTGKMKPDREAFQNVLDTLDCKPESVFFVDDNTLNVEAASRIGMQAVQVRGADGARHALVEAGIVSR